MSRYLSPQYVVQYLKAGRPVEQWLGAGLRDGQKTLRWLQLDREREGSFSVTVFEVFDDGNENLRDVYEFSPVDVDEPYGHTTTFDSLEAALQFATEQLGARSDRFVNRGVIQDEYADHGRSHSR